MKTLSTWIKRPRKGMERRWPILDPQSVQWDERTPVKAALANPACRYMRAEFDLPDGRVSVVEMTRHE